MSAKKVLKCIFYTSRALHEHNAVFFFQPHASSVAGLCVLILFNSAQPLVDSKNQFLLKSFLPHALFALHISAFPLCNRAETGFVFLCAFTRYLVEVLCVFLFYFELVFSWSLHAFRSVVLCVFFFTLLTQPFSLRGLHSLLSGSRASHVLVCIQFALNDVIFFGFFLLTISAYKSLLLRI